MFPSYHWNYHKLQITISNGNNVGPINSIITSALSWIIAIMHKSNAQDVSYVYFVVEVDTHGQLVIIYAIYIPTDSTSAYFNECLNNLSAKLQI